MNIQACVDNLCTYARAGVPLVVIRSQEKQRAVSVVRQAANRLSASSPERLFFAIHSSTKGMQELESGKSLRQDSDFMSALDYVSEQVNKRRNQVFVLTTVPDLSGENDVTRIMFDIIDLAVEHHSMLIIVTANSIWQQLQRSGMCLELDLPSEEEMYAIIRDTVMENDLGAANEWRERELREAAAILSGVSQIEAENVILTHIAGGALRREDLVEMKFAKNRLFSNIQGLEKIEVSANILDVGGLSGLKSWLEEKKKLFSAEKSAQMKACGLQPPRGILLVGVPGCGKSLSAKAIAAMWQLPLYKLDFATVQGQFVGQSENQLKDAFATAEHLSPCILWIDEIEKGLAASGFDSSGVTTRMVGQFLFWMQECRKQVFVVATANNVEKLPPELLRRGRFDEMFFVDLPTAEERAEIISMYLRRYLELRLEQAPLHSLVCLTDGFTGADLESSLRDIAYRKLANPQLEVDAALLEATLSNVIPLSKTNPRAIEDIREWGRERAVPASGRPIGGVADNAVNRRVLI